MTSTLPHVQNPFKGFHLSFAFAHSLIPHWKQSSKELFNFLPSSSLYQHFTIPGLGLHVYLFCLFAVSLVCQQITVTDVRNQKDTESTIYRHRVPPLLLLPIRCLIKCLLHPNLISNLPNPIIVLSSMALEAVIYSVDPFFGYNNKEQYYGLLLDDYSNSTSPTATQQHQHHGIPTSYWDSGIQVPDQLHVTSNYHSSSPEQQQHQFEMVEEPPVVEARRKRRRTKSSSKNKEEIENQRMTHIAVERNRRKQMNDYLSVLRSLMPASYVQRGDQASIIGGAINFVKELEQILQAMEAHKSTTPNQQEDDVRLPPASSLFADFFTFPQYSTRTQTQTYSTPEPLVEVAESSLATTTAAVGDIEVTMVESHANIKILAKKQPSQLVKLVAQMQSLSLTILHLNVTTTAHHMVLYSVSIKLEEGCHLNTVDEIAAAVNEMLRRIQEEAAFA